VRKENTLSRFYGRFLLLITTMLTTTFFTWGSEKCAVKDYILITEDYPINTDLNFIPKQARLTLITKIIHDKLTPSQKEAFDKIVVLDNFNLSNILKAVKSVTIDHLRTRLLVSDDTIFPMVARLREILQIPGPKLHSILPFCDKAESKRRLAGSKVAYPTFVTFSHSDYVINPDIYLKKIAEKLKFPIIAKPLNLAGSLEVQKIMDMSSLQAWCDTYSPKDLQKVYGREIEFELEEFINTNNSDLFHCDSIIKNGKVIFTQVCRYTYPCMEVTQGRPIGSLTIPADDPQYKALYHLPAQVIQAFKRYDEIPDGVMHLEAFRDHSSGKVTFLETQLRHPGADIRSAYKVHLNLDSEEIHFKSQMGLCIDHLIPDTKGPYAMWLYVPTQNGIVDALCLPHVNSKLYKTSFLVTTGEKTRLPTSLLMDKQTGLKMLITNENYETILQDFMYLKQFNPYIMEKTPPSE
jgi:hypothetical protein